MATTNPFYRFEDAIEVPGLSAGARNVSLAQQSLFNDINIDYSSGTIIQALDFINIYVDDYNTNYKTNFVVEVPEFPPYLPATKNAQIYIYDSNIVKLYPLHRISIVLLISTSGVIISSYASFLGPINADYNYAAPLFDGEKLAYDALISQYETGSSIFPRYYKYDASTGEAKSYIARFKDCKYYESLGFVRRVPVDTQPRANRPIISFGQLDSDAKFIISLYESVIAYSATIEIPAITFNDIIVRLQDLVLPDGYAFSYTSSIGLYNRYQHNIYKVGGGQAFTLVLRDDGEFLFQRFYAPSFSAFDIIGAYDENDSLPYEPLDFTKKYGGVFYDFEFCEFLSCAYPAKESYQMPVKSGDNLLFNIKREPSNLTWAPQTDIGLFDAEFNLIKKIGSASTQQYTCCTPYKSMYAGTFTQFNVSWSQIQNTCIANTANPATHELGFVFGVLNDPTKTREFWHPLTIPLINDQDVLDVFLSFNDLLNKFDIEELVVPTGLYAKLTYTPIDYDCTNEELQSFIVVREIGGGNEITWEAQITGGTTGFVTLDLYANAVVPSVKDGCYRFGLYKFGYSFDGLQSSWNQQSFNIGTSRFLAIVDASNIAVFALAIPTATAGWLQLLDFLSNNVPFMKVEYDGSNYLTITAYPYIDLPNHTIQIGTLNFSTGVITPITLDEAADVAPLYDENINELYAFSNPINHNDSDCFSTIIQYWGENNSVAEGFEYHNNWFQQIRLGINGGGKKPIITDSVYRQSNGVHRRPQNKQDLSIDLHTDFLDFETQAALVDATRHQNFVVDGQNLFVNGDIEVATIQDFTTQSSFEDLAQVKFSALIQGYQPKNSSCLTC